MKKFKVKVDEVEYIVEVEQIEGAKSGPLLRGTTSNRTPVVAQEQKIESVPKSEPVVAPVETKASQKTEASTGAAVVDAPIPGTVSGIMVKVGDKVSKGDVVLILEAMKMENEIMAPKSGIISEISIQKGATVNMGDKLIVID